MPPISGTGEAEKMEPPLPDARPPANDSPDDVRYQPGK